MARFLFASIPAAGHVNPTLPLARALMARGHAVGYVSGASMEQRVSPLVAQFFPAGPAMSAEEVRERWPEMGRLRGIRRTDFMIREIFYPLAARSAREMLDAVAAFAPDVLVFDSLTHCASIVADVSGLAWATTTVFPGLLEGKTAHLFGFGLPYPPKTLQRLASPLLRLLVRYGLRWYDRRFNAIRAQFDLPPIRDSYRASAVSPYLTLALVPPEFEYPRADWPPTVHFIGPSLWDRPHDYAAPDWLAALPHGRPLVYATIGTVQSIYQSAFFGTLFAALDGLDADVVVTTGGNVAALPTPPDNVRVERYVPNSVIMPKAQLVVHHGGLGTTLGALVHGKPAVVTPFADDQPDNAQRVRWLGAGAAVDPRNVSAAELRRAIETALASTTMREKAAALGQTLRRYDAGQTGAALLEKLAQTKAPVPRAGRQ